MKNEERTFFSNSSLFFFLAVFLMLFGSEKLIRKLLAVIHQIISEFLSSFFSPSPDVLMVALKVVMWMFIAIFMIHTLLDLSRSFVVIYHKIVNFFSKNK